MSAPNQPIRIEFQIVNNQRAAAAAREVRNEVVQLRAAQQGLVQTSGQGAQAVAGWNQTVQRAGTVSHDAARGMHVVRGAVTALAFEATGAAGPVGRLASGLLLFGGGSTLVLGVAAGIAVIGLAWRQATAGVREAREEHEKLGHTWAELVARGRPNVQLVGQLMEATQKLVAEEERLVQLAERRAAVTARTNAGGGIKGSETSTLLNQEIAARQGNVIALQQIIRQLQDQLRHARDEIAKEARDQNRRDAERQGREWVENFLRGLEQLPASEQMERLFAARGRFEALGRDAAKAWSDAFLKASDQAMAERPLGGALRLAPFSLGRLIAQGGVTPDTRAMGALGREPGQTGFTQQAIAESRRRAIAEGFAADAERERTRLVEFSTQVLIRAQSPQQIYTAGVAALERAHDLELISVEELTAGIKQLKKEMDAASKSSPVLASSIITAVAGVIAAFASGGSPGGILSAIGGVVGLIPGGQIAGAIIGGLGTVLSAGQSRGVRVDSYSNEALAQLRGLPNGPERVVLQVISPTSGEVVEETIYELGRRSRVDAAPRVPATVAAGG